MNSSDAKPNADGGLSWLFRVQVAGGAFFLLVALGVMLAFLSNSAGKQFQSESTVAVSNTIRMEDFNSTRFIESSVSKNRFEKLESLYDLAGNQIAQSIANGITVNSVAGKHGSFDVRYVSSSQSDAVSVLAALLRDFPAYTRCSPAEFVVIKAPKTAMQVGGSSGVRMLIGGAGGALLSLLLTPVIFRVLR